MIKDKPIKLYFAYGMNTNQEQMSLRCPGAKPLGRAVLSGYRFEFKTITETDEFALDMLEGYPEFYNKKIVSVDHKDQSYIAMTYIMSPREQSYPPTDGYYSMVSEGYQQFGLSQNQLLEARSRSNQEIWIYE